MKAVTILLALVLPLLVSDLAQSQVAGGTGTMGFQLGTYGRVRVDIPVYPGTRQLDRLSMVVALSSTNVFDYTEDSENLEVPSLTTGGIADTIATVLTDNSYSNIEPNVRVRVTVYSWHNDDFVIAKYTVTNVNTSAYTLFLGVFGIPKPSNSYGGETVAYDATKKVAYFFRTGETPHIGVKVLSGEPSSFHVLDWDVYSPNPDADEATDATRYDMTAIAGFDASLTAGVNGSAYNLNAGERTLAPGDSAIVYYGIISTASLEELLLEADSVQSRYDGTFTGIKPVSDVVPGEFSLSPNYPNPFNPETRITFAVKSSVPTTLKVYDLLGREVATLVDERLAPGSYSVPFHGEGLASGTYLYTLTAGSYRETRRMMLVR
jgi:hypothetical protein